MQLQNLLFIDSKNRTNDHWLFPAEVQDQVIFFSHFVTLFRRKYFTLRKSKPVFSVICEKSVSLEETLTKVVAILRYNLEHTILLSFLGNRNSVL
jgi:hypothetical protein